MQSAVSVLMQVRDLAALDIVTLRAVWDAAVQTAESHGQAVSSTVVAKTIKSVLGQGRPCAVVPHLLSTSDSWYTPPYVAAMVRQVFEGGQIDLDPCSTEAAQVTIQAGQFFTCSDDSLDTHKPWVGRVYVNPPFG